MAQPLNRHAIVLLAVKLVQPGKLADIVEGVHRILPSHPEYDKLKKDVRKELETLITARLVQPYEGQRYMLTSTGELQANTSGIAYLIEARRMYLLKETRRANQRKRGSTRNRSLLQ